MGNCLSKCDNEPFTLHAPRPPTLGYTKKFVSGIEKRRVKYFATNIYKYLGCIRFIEIIKSI